MPRVNPEILVWARETAGLTREDALRRLGIRPTKSAPALDRLIALESDQTPPTRALLVRMAHVYRRPLLTFYLSKPPRKGPRGQDFRTLPPDYTVADDALVDALIREVRARQSIVREALEAEDEANALPFINAISTAAGVPAVLRFLHDTLGADREIVRAALSPEEAFKRLRERAEAAGVYVILQGDLGSHHTAISPETFRGFALADRAAPFIVINDRDSPSAWSFTLLHELVHLCLGATGVSGSRSESELERFCNDAASAFLLDDDELVELRINDQTDIDTAQTRITAFARPRKLSRSMVAYRLYRAGAISYGYWRPLQALFRTLWLKSKALQRERAREAEGGPNYYVIRRHRLGDALVRLVRRKIAGGVLTTTRAAQVLAVRPQTVGPLIAGAASDNSRAS